MLAIDIAVLYDLDEMMPETLWTVAEAVRGGGIFAMILPTSSWDPHSLATLQTPCHRSR